MRQGLNVTHNTTCRGFSSLNESSVMFADMPGYLAPFPYVVDHLLGLR